MTTTADFYDGRGRHTVWLGSLEGSVDPGAVRAVACGRLLLETTDPMTYADAVTDLLAVSADDGHGAAYYPHDGWPWAGSRRLDWVYTFAHGRVEITTGRAWLTTRRQAAR